MGSEWTWSANGLLRNVHRSWRQRQECQVRRRGEAMSTSVKAKTVPTTSIHKTWNRKLPPALSVRPGELVFFDALDASGGAIDRNSNTETIANIDFRRLDPLMGPVYIEGARPGDALQVDVVDLKPKDWGWTGLMRDFGLLASEITAP